MVSRITRARTVSPLAALACALGIASSGCDNAAGAQPAPSASPPAPTVASGACSGGAASPGCSAEAQGTVTRVVFIGKKEACDCTRKAIGASRKALEAALAAGHAMPVETLEVDVDEEKVTGYRMMKPFMTLPAIYFLDIHEGVVEMLQGEVSEAQVRAALK